MSLMTAFDQVADFRRGQGQRHRVSHVLVCLLLGTLNGAVSWRDHDAFVRRHKQALLKHLRPRRERLPSYSTMRRVLVGVDFEALSAAFLAWARTQIEISPDEWLSIDGKSLRSTASEPFEAQQNFTALVSLYAQKRGLVVAARAYENKEQSEAHVVEQLLASFGQGELSGAGLSLDALHCRKKPAASSEGPGPTI